MALGRRSGMSASTGSYGGSPKAGAPDLPLTLLILLSLLFIAIAILQFLFDPHYIFVGLPVFTIVWYFSRFSS
jgi:hypothetical protein